MLGYRLGNELAIHHPSKLLVSGWIRGEDTVPGETIPLLTDADPLGRAERLPVLHRPPNLVIAGEYEHVSISVEHHRPDRTQLRVHRVRIDQHVIGPKIDVDARDRGHSIHPSTQLSTIVGSVGASVQPVSVHAKLGFLRNACICEPQRVAVPALAGKTLVAMSWRSDGGIHQYSS